MVSVLSRLVVVGWVGVPAHCLHHSVSFFVVQPLKWLQVLQWCLHCPARISGWARISGCCLVVLGLSLLYRRRFECLWRVRLLCLAMAQLPSSATQSLLLSQGLFVPFSSVVAGRPHWQYERYLGGCCVGVCRRHSRSPRFGALWGPPVGRGSERLGIGCFRFSVPALRSSGMATLRTWDRVLFCCCLREGVTSVVSAGDVWFSFDRVFGIFTTSFDSRAMRLGVSSF